MATVPLTASMARDQSRARSMGVAQQERANHGESLLETQDTAREADYVIYVYNLLNRAHNVKQTGFNLFIPACEKGEKFAYTTLPAFTKDVFNRPGSTEYYYKTLDGRKAATSLLNPAAFPSTDWDTQLGNWAAEDQVGNNLNLYGVFWSLTKPDNPKLEEECALFRKRALLTMNQLIAAAEQFAAAGDLKSISPLMHFAMDYLGKQAPWHMTHEHMVSCPNCGMLVKEGIAYHRNDFGERCIIDHERYERSIARVPAVPERTVAPAEVAELVQKKKPAKKAPAATT